MVLDNRQLLDAVGSHRRPSLERLKIGGYGDDVSGHDLANWNTCDVSKAIFHQLRGCEVLFMLH